MLEKHLKFLTALESTTLNHSDKVSIWTNSYFDRICFLFVTEADAKFVPPHEVADENRIHAVGFRSSSHRGFVELLIMIMNYRNKNKDLW